MAKLVKIVEIKEDKIIVMYGIQSFCVHNFGVRNYRTHIKRAALEINNRRHIQLGELLRIANAHELTIDSTRHRK